MPGHSSVYFCIHFCNLHILAVVAIKQSNYSCCLLSSIPPSLICDLRTCTVYSKICDLKTCTARVGPQNLPGNIIQKVCLYECCVTNNYISSTIKLIFEYHGLSSTPAFVCDKPIFDLFFKQQIFIEKFLTLLHSGNLLKVFV